MERQKLDSMKDQLKVELIKSGEIDRLKILLKQRLSESGWREEMKLKCKEIIAKQGVEKITFEELLNAITAEGRRTVSGEVKEELLKEIKKAAKKGLQIHKQPDSKFMTII